MVSADPNERATYAGVTTWGGRGIHQSGEDRWNGGIRLQTLSQWEPSAVRTGRLYPTGETAFQAFARALSRNGTQDQYPGYNVPSVKELEELLRRIMVGRVQDFTHTRRQ